MPAHHQKPAPLAPASPRNTAKYTNKDGSKFITVPKASPSDSSRPSTPTIAKSNKAPPPADSTGLDTSAPTVNRKKQKRRQKAAAKAAAAQAANGHPSPALSSDKQMPADYELVASDEDDDVYDLADDAEPMPTTNGHIIDPKANKKNKKKKKKTGPGVHAEEMDLAQHPTPAPRGSGMSRDKIWSTSNHEERERIKEFWLGLGEDDRKSLVKVEKDAVLKKMKEQQKHTCSCTVCGRKRTAIEEELEGLYDAYYLELEQFANQGEGPPMLPPPPRDFSIRQTRGLPGGYPRPPPARGRIVEHVGDDDEELEEAYSEDEAEDDEYSDDEPPEEFHGSPDRDVADFLTFGNSLQVKGGILTVADDLLKNDGRRFIEMMEQLAERRMAREEDAREHFARGYGHPNGSYSAPHNHPPPEDEDYEDEEEEEEEDYDDSQDEEYEDEEDPMTEEQRMEEGRRMFQIFAARMFEQRVLSAYKEKVAKERQEKLLEELEEESRAVDEQKAKKAKNAQKKKDKAAQRKQALADEKARKEAEKAAEETARIEAERKKIAEQKQKAEEKRKQKEAQKKAEEDARLKKEAERLRRIHEQKEKQAEVERKAREAKEREKKLKDEQRTKEREAREQKEREAQERKEKQERDKREKEARAAKSQKESREAAEAAREEQLQRAKEEKAAPKVSSVQIAQTQPSQPAKLLPQHPPNPASFISPKIPVATPAIPKAPTPIRPRTTSQQHGTGPASSSDSQTASVPSQSASPHSVTPVYTSPSSTGPERRISAGTPLPMMNMQPPPGLGPHGPPPPPGFRPNPGHNMMIPPPGINSSAVRGYPPVTMPPPGDGPVMTHGRQGSIGFESAPGTPGQPIGRPAPIGRPGSVSHGYSRDKEEDTQHLGSRVLVEDDEPLGADAGVGGMRHQPLGPRGGFAAGPFIDSGFPMGHNPWGPINSPPQPFPPATAQQPFALPTFGNPGWGPPSGPPGFHVGSPSGLGSIRAQPRHVTVRLLLSQACKELTNSTTADKDGYVDLVDIKGHVSLVSGDPSISEQDLLNLCDTVGSLSNGGGSFDVKQDAMGLKKIRWVPDTDEGLNPHFRAVGAPDLEKMQHMGTEESPSRRMNLLERIGVTPPSATAESRALRIAMGMNTTDTAQASTNTHTHRDDASLWENNQSTMRGTHKKGISENITYSGYHGNATDESSKVDTWVGFYNPRKNGRRSLGP
ncbi:salt tolerance down-regulator domain-containing protein [Trichoderma breve]|uniref:Stress response protein NST1 n=1 Tax=Trichoderma breve TaxID=2034170 RepID=A0A9W9B9Z5_9HYPO|nr:salt tolerance down-regulator domain-containing protein [Trichoderma breve]KAJ4859255.1 salt tolerance down-regulator domain-containing protein [Trichoderma breve]